MPEADSAKLRIYCICGQKMKVSPTMYGRPGKCIACHQKIRIPREDEIPEGTRELYLKDHPEFLRKARHAPEQGPAGAEDAANVVTLGEEEEPATPVPLDVLEPLRVLASLEHKIVRQLEALRRGDTDASSAADKATLMGYRSLVRNARSGLDDQLRKRLHQVTDQMAAAEEEIARNILALRLGETDYQQFLEAVLPLRHRRELLARRRENLRGWLATGDPYLAGGYEDLPFEDVPFEEFEVAFPLEPSPRGGQALVDECVRNLRVALEERNQSERRLAEVRRMEQEGALAGQAREDCLADAEAAYQRAQARVKFGRDRLTQVIDDCENDIRAIKARLELAREQAQREALPDQEFQVLELQLLQGQRDNRRARELAADAISANAPQELPQPAGTFLKRMARPGKRGGIGPDSWLAWVGAVLLVLSIVTPISSAQRTGTAMLTDLMVLLPFLLAGLLVIFASFPKRDLRGILINLVWLAGCVAYAYRFHEEWYSPSVIGAAMRNDPLWYLQPGILLLAVCAVVVGAAAFVSLAPFQNLRRLPHVTVILILLAMGLILTDAGGLLSAEPYLAQPHIEAPQAGQERYDVTITVGNRGSRPIWLGSTGGQAPTPATFLLERRIGGESWEDCSVPHSMKRSDTQWWNTVSGGSFPAVTLGPGEQLALRYKLRPGVYSTRLAYSLFGPRDIAHEFKLDAISKPAGQETAPAGEEAEQSAGEPEQEPASNESAAAAPEMDRESEPGEATVGLLPFERGVDVIMYGVINAEDRSPRFSITLTYPNGRTVRRNVALEDTVYGPWRAIEFNPRLKTLTIGTENDLRVLERGEPLTLPSAD